MLKYNIESVHTNDRTVFISGWAFNTDNPGNTKIKIENIPMSEIKIHYVDRPDVEKSFSIKSSTIGFQAMFNNNNKVKYIIINFDGESIKQKVYIPHNKPNSNFSRKLFEIYKAYGIRGLLSRAINGKNYSYSKAKSEDKDRYIEQILSLPKQDMRNHDDSCKDTILRTEQDIKYIAFYLPQFHTFEENDKWWGKGFTEWSNVGRSIPQFLGHEQPKLPGELGYYDLKLESNQLRQIELAQLYGLYGFCFYYYWFHGKRLMNLPLDQFSENEKIDFPFCLCWANENWTKRWDGMEGEVLIAQEHSPSDDLNVIKDLYRYIEKNNYIKINGKPVILIYRVDLFPDIKGTISIWRDHARKEKNQELMVICVRFLDIKDPSEYGCDGAVDFPPHNYYTTEISGQCKIINPNFKGRIYDYAEIVRTKKYLEPNDYKLFKTLFPSWDNTARRDNFATVFHNASPELYKEWLNDIGEYTKKNLPSGEQFVFINAWNEWAEGAVLEPSMKLGYKYLEATREAFFMYRKNLKENGGR